MAFFTKLYSHTFAQSIICFFLFWIRIGGFFGIAYLFSEHRNQIGWHKILRLCLCQVIFIAVFSLSWMQKAFFFLAQGAQALQNAMLKGTSFVFGYLGGGVIPFISNGKGSPFILIFQAFPMIVVMSALSMLLFHWKILPFIVRFLSRGAGKIWKIGGALATGMAAKLFFGQSDAPLLIRPYLSQFSRNELFSMMTAGMATMSAALFVLCANFLKTSLGYPQAIAHVLMSAVINVVSALIMAELFVPEDKETTKGMLNSPYTFTNSMEALSEGTKDGWSMMWAIAAILIVALTLVELSNDILGSVTTFLFGYPLQLQQILGYFLWPFAWCMGIDAAQCVLAGSVVALKIVFNEIVALGHVSQWPVGIMSSHNLILLTYATCGFGNISSIAIQITAFGAMAPSRRQEIILLAPKAMIAGIMAGGLSSAFVSAFFL